MTHLKRFARKPATRRLFLSSLFLLSLGAGSSQAQNCPKPSFQPFDATIQAYASNGTMGTALDFLPSLLDSTGVTFSYSLAGATTGSGSAVTGTGNIFNIGTTYVTLSATNSCGTSTLNFSVSVRPRFYEFGEFGGHNYYRTPYFSSWKDADSMARSIGGELVAVNSEAEDNFLSRAVPDTMRAWMGLVKVNNAWKWTNNEAVTYTNWCKNQPDNWLGDLVNGQNFGLIHSSGVAVGTNACWDDGHEASPAHPNYFYGAVEITPPAPCSGSFSVNPSSTINTGGIATDLYLGYGAQSDTFKSTATGIGELTYDWSGSAVSMLNCTKCAEPEFTPTKAGIYTFSLTVTDLLGCSATTNKVICVKDIRDVSTPGNIWVCHGSSDKSITVSSASGHVGHGDALGKCGQVCGSTARKIQAENRTQAASVQVYPNPTQNAFFVEVPQSETATVTLLDIQGKVLETRSLGSNDNRKVRFDLENSPRGMYIIDVVYGDQRFHSKIVLQ